MVQLRSKYDLLQCQSVKRMISALRAKRGGVPSKSTESGFLTYIFRYCQFYADDQQLLKLRKTADPDDIIKERKEHWQSGDDDIRRQHEEIVMRFMNALREEKVRGKTSSSGKVAYALTAVRAFYRTNYRDLKGIPSPVVVPQIKYKVPTKEELAVACELAEKRLRTWILLDKDCGMSPFDLLNLTGKVESPRFGTIKEQLRKGLIPIHIHIIREKTKTTSTFYDTFFGEDAVEALQEYLPKRRRERRFFDIGERMLEIEFVKLSKKLGWTHFVPKSCRKFFSSQLKFGNVNNAAVEYWMGHSLRKVEGAYIVERLRDHPEVLAQMYLDAYDHLKLPS